MDIDLYGFTFSNFIKGFKKNFKIDNNTYDYMSFLHLWTFKTPTCVAKCLGLNPVKSIVRNFALP